MQKEQTLHEFSGFDAFSLFALVVGSFILVSGIVAHGISAQRLNQAEVDCDSIGLKIISRLDSDKTIVRQLASKPDSRPMKLSDSLDPWGHEYLYRVFSDSSNRRVVVVYSAGPDGKLQTQSHDFTVSPSGRLVAVKFQGDDIGSVQRAWP